MNLAIFLTALYLKMGFYLIYTQKTIALLKSTVRFFEGLHYFYQGLHAV